MPFPLVGTILRGGASSGLRRLLAPRSAFRTTFSHMGGHTAPSALLTRVNTPSLSQISLGPMVSVQTRITYDPRWKDFLADMEYLARNPKTGIRAEYEDGDIQRSEIVLAMQRARRKVKPFSRDSLEDILIEAHWNTEPQLYTASPIGRPYPQRTSKFQHDMGPVQRDLVRGIFLEDISAEVETISRRSKDNKPRSVKTVVEPNYRRTRDTLARLGFRDMPSETEFRREIEGLNPTGISGADVQSAVSKAKAKSLKRRPPRADEIGRALIASHATVLPNAYSQQPRNVPFAQRVRASHRAMANLQDEYVNQIYNVHVMGAITPLVTREGAKELARQNFKI